MTEDPSDDSYEVVATAKGLTTDDTGVALDLEGLVAKTYSASGAP